MYGLIQQLCMIYFYNIPLYVSRRAAETDYYTACHQGSQTMCNPEEKKNRQKEQKRGKLENIWKTNQKEDNSTSYLPGAYIWSVVAGRQASYTVQKKRTRPI